MRWFSTQPTTPGLYYISHPRVTQEVLDLVKNDYDGTPAVWRDPNQNREVEIPDNCLYAGPLPNAPRADQYINPMIEKLLDDNTRR